MKTNIVSAEVARAPDGKLVWVLRAKVRSSLSGIYRIVDELVQRYPQAEIVCEIDVAKAGGDR